MRKVVLGVIPEEVHIDKYYEGHIYVLISQYSGVAYKLSKIADRYLFNSVESTAGGYNGVRSDPIELIRDAIEKGENVLMFGTAKEFSEFLYKHYNNEGDK